MNKNILLDALQKFTEESMAEFSLPTQMQSGDTEQVFRSPEVYKMRLPDSTSYKKKAPYIIHQVVTGNDVQTEGSLREASAEVRTVFCVYCDDEQEGSLQLLEIMEHLRINLLKASVIGKMFRLNLKEGLSTLVYQEDTAPFFLGEMLSTWMLPAVEMEVKKWL